MLKFEFLLHPNTMSFLEGILKTFVGDKSKKDLKTIRPYIDKIKVAETVLSSMTHDELRQKTIEFKTKIHDVKFSKSIYFDEMRSFEQLDAILKIPSS